MRYDNLKENNPRFLYYILRCGNLFIGKVYNILENSTTFAEVLPSPRSGQIQCISDDGTMWKQLEDKLIYPQGQILYNYMRMQCYFKLVLYIILEKKYLLSNPKIKIIDQVTIYILAAQHPFNFMISKGTIGKTMLQGLFN